MTSCNKCMSSIVKSMVSSNASRYKIPRNEIEITERQLKSYQKQLKKISERRLLICAIL